MTCEEFEADYAKKAGVTVEELHRLGLRAAPCDDGGWAMVSEEGESGINAVERLSEWKKAKAKS